MTRDNRRRSFSIHSKTFEVMIHKTKRSTKGIAFNKSKKKYDVRITENKKDKWLGSYTSKQEAMDVFDAEAIRIHGDKAITNAFLQSQHQTALELQSTFDEEWRVVCDHKDYSISNRGNVMSNRTGQTLIHHPLSLADKHRIVRLYTGGKPKAILVHRLVAIAFLPPPSGSRTMVDHADCDPSNNCAENLRWATRTENSRNSRKHTKQASSQYKGVSRHKNKWSATICLNGKKKYLGVYVNEKDAADVYDRWALEAFGSFARTNAMMETQAVEREVQAEEQVTR